MSEIRQHNLKIISKEYENQRALADAIDATPGYISQLLIGGCSFGEKAARKIENALNKPLGWMDTVHDDIDNFDTKSPHDDTNSNSLVISQDEKCKSITDLSTDKDLEIFATKIRRFVPLISYVQAGEWCEAIDNYVPGDAEEWLPCPSSHSESTYALRVRGDSMTNPIPGQPSYPEGVIVFVDSQRVINNGCRIIAKLPDSNEVTFKEYREDGGKRFLKPLNPQYPIQEIGDDTQICGVIIGKYESE